MIEDVENCTNNEIVLLKTLHEPFTNLDLMVNTNQDSFNGKKDIK